MFPEKNKGSQTAGALVFSFGYERAGEILEEAIRKDCRIRIVYGEGEDNLEKIMFVKRK
ncbi:MAG TPA: hypothetical protein PLZ15_14690 [Melioribacteraceae bacterium]|nr:hypothetical protein [Melioribacteraceae bacterium]